MPLHDPATAPTVHTGASASVAQQLLGSGLLAPAQGINWCESDYAVSPLIAEWWNTLSNVAFLVAPPIPPLHLLHVALGQLRSTILHTFILLFTIIMPSF